MDIPSLVYHSILGNMIEANKYISGYYDVKPVLKMDTCGNTRGHHNKGIHCSRRYYLPQSYKI